MVAAVASSGRMNSLHPHRGRSAQPDLLAAVPGRTRDSSGPKGPDGSREHGSAARFANDCSRLRSADYCNPI